MWCVQGDVITFQGEEGNEIFFLLEGRCVQRLYPALPALFWAAMAMARKT